MNQQQQRKPDIDWADFERGKDVIRRLVQVHPDQRDEQWREQMVAAKMYMTRFGGCVHEEDEGRKVTRLQRLLQRSQLRRYQTHEAFQAAALAHPDNSEPLHVYADWLQEQGDQRGDSLRHHVGVLTPLFQAAATSPGPTPPDWTQTNLLDRINGLPQGDKWSRILATALIRHTPDTRGGTWVNHIRAPESLNALMAAELDAHGLLPLGARQQAYRTALAVPASRQGWRDIAAFSTAHNVPAIASEWARDVGTTDEEDEAQRRMAAALYGHLTGPESPIRGQLAGSV